MTDTPRIFDLLKTVEYMHSLGATGVTVSTIRAEISSGRLPYTKLGKRFYVSKVAIDAWITRAERRNRL